jgi:Na+/citrate or Na+/malate symporter
MVKKDKNSWTERNIRSIGWAIVLFFAVFTFLSFMVGNCDKTSCVTETMSSTYCTFRYVYLIFLIVGLVLMINYEIVVKKKLRGESNG